MLRSTYIACLVCSAEWQSASQEAVAYRGGGVLGGSNPPPPEIPKALQNRAKLNPIVKTVKNYWI